MSAILAPRSSAWLRLRRPRTSAGISFPEGNATTILGSKTDGFNTVDWLTKRPWSNWQGRHDRPAPPPRSIRWASPRSATPATAAMNVQGFGAGVRTRVGSVLRAGQPGAPRRRGADAVPNRLKLYGEQNQVRPDVSAGDVARGSDPRCPKSFDPRAAPAAGTTGRKALWHLPTQDIMKSVDGPRGTSSPTPCRSKPAAKMMQRTPNLIRRGTRRRPLSRRSEAEDVPGLWFHVV